MLFDKAINDIEHCRFEVARLTLQTLINTYDTSEYLAKAKLAIADSWYREGGAHGLAQAEAEYKDFILFYPAMEEAAEAQNKVCDIQYRRWTRPTAIPCTPCAPRRNAASSWCSSPIASSPPTPSRSCATFRKCWPRANSSVGYFYHKKGSIPGRRQSLAGPGGSVFRSTARPMRRCGRWPTSTRMGRTASKNKQATAYQRIVQDYPLSTHAEDATAKLEVMKRPVPEVDPTRLQPHEVRDRKTAVSTDC